MTETCDALVIGGGFYGLYLAEFLADRFERVVVCERNADLMQRASLHNQARVHNGYHYPRSILTAVRSRVNFERFVNEFRPAIDNRFEKIYAVGRRLSKISADRFYQFVGRIGAPMQPADRSVCSLFDPGYVEAVCRVTEHAFDAVILKTLMADRVRRAGIDVRLRTEVAGVKPASAGAIEVSLAGHNATSVLRADHVICCAYSQLNQPGAAEGLPQVPLKHELTEIALVKVPEPLRRLGVTVMCGPFFSCLPFPARGLHTLSHVRYTPHGHWYDGNEGFRPAYELCSTAPRQSAYAHMVRDAARYLPAMAECRYHESLWEVKTVLPSSEIDDSRPILFKPHFGMRNYHLVMGAKIDNVYDVVDVLGQTLAGGTP